MTKFQPGQRYSAHFGDSRIYLTVVSRTDSTITTKDGKRLRINKRVSAFRNAETVFPLGRYSMAPSISAA